MKFDISTLLLTFAVATSSPAAAQSLTTIHSFSGIGGVPRGGLIKIGSHLIGTGRNDIFKIPLAGGPGETELHAFSDIPDGSHPSSPLIMAGGVLYGTTHDGGSDGEGSVFKINANGSNYAVLHSFTLAEGIWPQGGLIYAGGSFYGTADHAGGIADGSVYNMDLAGNVTVLHSFPDGPPDGGDPASAPLKVNNYLYGTTSEQDDEGLGTIYRVKTNGNGFQILHQFSGSPNDGARPYFSDLVSFAGHLWGTTYLGGQFDIGTVYRIDADGSNYTVVHSFAGAPYDAAWSNGPLLLVYPIPGQPGVLYGATSIGGENNLGAIFKINAAGVETLVHSFSGTFDGQNPETALMAVQDNAGVIHLYGTTRYGGQFGSGTVFAFTP